jgi:uncharacterized coiled-coil protein SlyX
MDRKVTMGDVKILLEATIKIAEQQSTIADLTAALTAANERAEKAEAHNYNMYDKLCKSQSETKEAERNSNNYAISLRKVEQDLTTAKAQVKRLELELVEAKEKLEEQEIE